MGTVAIVTGYLRAGTPALGAVCAMDTRACTGIMICSSEVLTDSRSSKFDLFNALVMYSRNSQDAGSQNINQRSPEAAADIHASSHGGHDARADHMPSVSKWCPSARSLVALPWKYPVLTMRRWMFLGNPNHGVALPGAAHRTRTLKSGSVIDPVLQLCPSPTCSRGVPYSTRTLVFVTRHIVCTDCCPGRINEVARSRCEPTISFMEA
jgi:hypothetical protein